MVNNGEWMAHFFANVLQQSDQIAEKKQIVWMTNNNNVGAREGEPTQEQTPNCKYKY